MNDNDTTHQFVTDRRGVSEVIGSILVFGLVIALISLLQVQAIPNANEDVEFEHNQDLQSDMTRFSESISRTSARGARESVSVTLGTGYPTRLIFYNPPSASGRLRATQAANVSLANVRATDLETADYLSGERRNFTSSSVVYRPNYNLYGSAPVSGYDNTVLFNQYDQTTMVEDGGSLVDGREISLVTLSDGLNSESADSVSVSTVPVSAPARTVTVSNATGETMRITVPTRLSESVWVEKILASEMDDDEDQTDPADDGPEPGDRCSDIEGTETNRTDDRYVVGCSYTPGTALSNHSNETALLTLTFEGGVSYELRTSRVAFGEHSPRPNAAYLTTVSGDNTGIPESGAQRLVVEARDRYNNPVVGRELTFSVGPDRGELRNASGSTGQQVTVTTDPDGQAAVVYRGPANVDSGLDARVNVSLDGQAGTPFDASTPRNATFRVAVNDIGEVPTGQQPTITIDDVSDESGNVLSRLNLTSDAGYRVDWSADDPTGDGGYLERVEIRLVNQNNGHIADRTTYDVSGSDGASGTAELVDENGEGNSYRIVAHVEDQGNRHDEDEVTDTADGSNP